MGMCLSYCPRCKWQCGLSEYGCESWLCVKCRDELRDSAIGSDIIAKLDKIDKRISKLGEEIDCLDAAKKKFTAVLLKREKKYG